MIALTLIQPYATLVALAEKLNETRGWSTKVRGEVAITASKGWPRWYRDICFEEPFHSTLMLRLRENVAGHRDTMTVLEEKLPRGKVVAVVEIVACFPTTGPTPYPLSEKERAFGNYAPGRFVFRMNNIRPLAEPVPCVGNRMFWKLPDDVEAAVRSQL